MPRSKLISYRPDIDGLRALAVAMVLVFHLAPRALRGGFVGVDVFFVISGYLIFAITRRELAAGTFSLLQFYGRRVRRLVPALLLMLAAVTAGGWLVMSGPEFKVLGRHLAAGVAYVSNFAYWREAGYFDADAEAKPLLHLWSLAIEEQFYLGWPILAAWLARGRRRFAPWTVALAAASLVGCLILTATDRTAAFYFSPTRFWEILFGCVLALEPWPPRSDRRREVEAACGLALILVAVSIFNGAQRFPGSRALLPTLGAVLLIGAGPATAVGRALAAPVLVWLGRISYPLYLWHWPVIVFTKLLAPNLRETWAGRGVMAALAIGLAQLTFSLVERRAHELDARRGAWWLMAPWLAFGAVGLAILRLDGVPARTPELTAQLADVGDRPPAYYVNEHCPRELDGELKFCRQNRAGSPTHVVIGDSHANHVFEGVAPARAQTWLALGNAICPPLLDVPYETGGARCAAGLRRMIDFVTKTPSVGTIVLSFYGTYASVTDASGVPVPNEAHFFIGEPGLGEEPRYAVFERGLENLIAALEASGKKIVLAHDVPDFPYRPQECIGRPFAFEAPKSCVQPRAAVATRQRRYRAMMKNLIARHPRLTVYDPLNYLCDAATCSARDDRGPLYFDRDHLGGRGSVRAFSALRD